MHVCKLGAPKPALAPNPNTLSDRHGRIGPLGTVFYNTLLDENAASHIALGGGFSFLVDPDVVPRVNESAQHIELPIGEMLVRRAHEIVAKLGGKTFGE